MFSPMSRVVGNVGQSNYAAANMFTAIDIPEKKRLANISEKLEDELAFWSRVHQTPVEPLPLFPFSNINSREPLKAYDIETFDITLDEELASLIRQMSFNVGRKVVLLQTPYGSDIVLTQIFQALANGGTLIVVGQKSPGNPVHISQLLLR
ncbi:uncharacterized protein F4812DRAFT_459224 [Daldinia caldariorum]|uniref:uncharacterized protein n=1 Tax=Daldinia caldariorum TaxID=326644 RepID=UPI00200727C0|nr:uncharacterized protein F4812DRAFT_459224 [Daldinia caldariorum]KAI1467942.1 hypothetical protein F4812DRAFT_459224 [Daldinia caldariorum]